MGVFGWGDSQPKVCSRGWFWRCTMWGMAGTGVRVLTALPCDVQYGYDVETGDGLLYPGIDATDNALRWGFVRKVRWGLLDGRRRGAMRGKRE